MQVKSHPITPLSVKMSTKFKVLPVGPNVIIVSNGDTVDTGVKASVHGSCLKVTSTTYSAVGSSKDTHLALASEVLPEVIVVV